MPGDVRHFTDAEVNRLIKFYEQAEREILQQLNRALLRGNKTEYLAQMKKNVDIILEQLQEGNRTWCSEAIPRVYSEGLRSADMMIKDAGIGVSAGFGGIHQEAAQVLAENAFQRFEDVAQVIGRQVDDIYRNLALENIRGTVVGYDTWKQTARRYREQLAERGVTGFKDRSGRIWNMRSYTEMVARTTCMEAHIQGTVNRLAEQDHDLVEVSSHSGACPLCVPWENKVLSITGKTEGYPTLEEAKAAGLFHCNCAHAVGLYIDLDKEIEELEEDQLDYLQIKDADKIDKATKTIIDEELDMIPQVHREILKFAVKEIVVIDKGNSGYDREKGIIYLLEGLTEGEVIHEAAHAIETELGLYNNKQFLGVLADAVKGYTLSDVIIDTKTFNVPVALLKSQKFISGYQGLVDLGVGNYGGKINIKALREYFSEGYREYVVNPRNLKAKDLGLYNYIEELR